MGDGVEKLTRVQSADRQPRDAPGYIEVSPFTFVLVFIPLVLVFLLFNYYSLAFALTAVAVLLGVYFRKAVRWKTERSLLAFSIVGAVLLSFILLPILNLLFTTEPDKIISMARDAHVQDAIWITLSSAFMATAISLVFGIPLAYVLARERFTGKAVVEGIVDMPVVIPHTVAGIAMIFIFGRAGVLGGPIFNQFGVLFSDTFWGIVLVMVFVCLPFVVNQVRDGFLKVDPRLEHVARTLGSSRMGALLRVTLPLTWRSIMSGAIMAWARAVSEFGSIAVIAYYPKSVNTLIFEWYNFFGYTYTKPLAALLLIIALGIFIFLRAIPRLRRNAHDPA